MTNDVLRSTTRDHGHATTAPKTWAVFDPYEGALELFATETEAVECANSRIELYLDETWDEDVEGIAVVRIVHAVEQHVIARKGDDNWDEITGFRTDVNMWCDYLLGPVQ